MDVRLESTGVSARALNGGVFAGAESVPPLSRVLTRPEEVDRDAKQQQEKARPAVDRADDQQPDADGGGERDVEGGKHGVAERLVGTLDVGSFSAEDEEAGGGQGVEEEDGEDDVVEQLVVAAGEDEEAGPDALEDEADSGDTLLVKRANGAE